MNDADRGMVLFEYSFRSNTVRELGDVEESRHNLARLGHLALINNTDPEHGDELWAYNEDTNGFGLLADLDPGRAPQSPMN